MCATAADSTLRVREWKKPVSESCILTNLMRKCARCDAAHTDRKARRRERHPTMVSPRMYFSPANHARWALFSSQTACLWERFFMTSSHSYTGCLGTSRGRLSACCEPKRGTGQSRKSVAALLHCCESASRQCIEPQHLHLRVRQNSLQKTRRRREECAARVWQEDTRLSEILPPTVTSVVDASTIARTDNQLRVLPARSAWIWIVSSFTCCVATSRRGWNETRRH